jgi:ABC-2 type transport system permease protein
MLRGLWKLTWLEIKIFVREPLGLFGTVGIPVVLFVALGRLFSGDTTPDDRSLVELDLPVFGSLLIALNAVLSLVTVIAIYREGGILKRLRATPLRPHVILTAHVVVKLLMTAATLALTILVGARYYPIRGDVNVVAYAVAFLFVTTSILSIGFVIASVVPTARFAQPVASLLLYPMVALSGLFVPVESLPATFRIMARVVPLTYAVSLLKGVWKSDPWSAHLGDMAALVVVFAAGTALSAKVFRWE